MIERIRKLRWREAETDLATTADAVESAVGQTGRGRIRRVRWDEVTSVARAERS
jgi:hypothetical protein